MCCTRKSSCVDGPGPGPDRLLLDQKPALTRRAFCWADHQRDGRSGLLDDTQRMRMLLPCGTAALLLAVCLGCQANDRPFESARTAVSEDDDQVWSFETWTRKIGPLRSLTVEPDYSFDPANSLQIELTRTLDRNGQDSSHEAELEYKHVFNRLARDGWGWAASVAFGAERSPGRTVKALTLRLPVSLDLGQLSGAEAISGTLLHLNLGLHKDDASRRSASNALAIEHPLFQRSLLFAEWARQGSEQLGQLGVRHWMRRDKLALDIAWQQRRVDGVLSTGWVAGIGWYDL
jgi:hypothetical protein